MAQSEPKEQCFFYELYNCGPGKFIQCSRIHTILSASEIRQDDIRLRSELSDGSQSIRCHKNCI